MAWKKSTTTPHTCGGPVFGRLAEPGSCERCDELRKGAEPVKAWNHRQKQFDEMRRIAMAKHFAPGGKAERIRAAGGVDTAFEW